MRRVALLFFGIGLSCALGKDGKDGSGDDESDNGGDNGSDNGGDNGSDSGGDNGSDNGGDNGGGGPHWYDDIDGDGYGNPETLDTSAEQPPDTVDNGDDCNDLSASIHPGADEVCDNIDNDCDELVDDDDPDRLEGGAGTWYLDGDGDGHYGLEETVRACDRPSDAGTREQADDCDDSDASVNPDAEEECGDGVDNNCDGGGEPCTLGDTSAARADVKYQGGNEGDRAGSGVAILDFNGDGDPDVVMGAYDADNGSAEPGEVVVYTTASTGTLSESSAFGAYRMASSADNANFGYNVEAVGDRNGDGYEDFVAGAYAIESSRGVAYWFAGGTRMPSSTAGYLGGGASGDDCGVELAADPEPYSGSLAPVAVACVGEGDGSVYLVSGMGGSGSEISFSSSTNDFFGAALAWGDFDGDGDADLVATSRGISADYAVYLFLGPVSGGSVSSLVDDTDTLDFVLYGSELANLGDLDGDGYPELVLSAGRTYEARIYPGASSRMLSSGGELDFPASDQYVRGDFNADGNPDYASGSGGSNAANIFYGPFDTNFEADWISLSGESSDYFGSALAAGDLNNDGVDDLLVGGTGDDSTGTEAGAAWGFFGGAL